MYAARLANLSNGQRAALSTDVAAITIPQAAAVAGVSPASVSRAKAVIASGDAALISAVAIKRALEPELKQAAAERQAAPIELRKTFPKSELGRAMDKAAAFTGMSRPTLQKAEAIVAAAEAAENFERKDFTPSEAVAIKRALEPEIREAARERQAMAGGSAPGKLPEAVPTGETREIAAKFTGFGARTLDKAEAIVAAAEAEPEKFGIAGTSHCRQTPRHILILR